MATTAEQTFRNTVIAAEGVRQVAKAAAFATYGFAQSGLATYLAALQSADNTFMAAVNSAANTLAEVGFSIPNSGPSSGNVNPGNLGQSGALSPQNVLGPPAASFGAIA